MSDQGAPSACDEVLVPHLYAAFRLDSCSDINLDPLVPAVYCFLTKGPAPAELAFQHGTEWYPSRAISSLKGEATRLKRFAEKYDHIFLYVKDGEALELRQNALSGGDPHECDEWLYRIILHRIHSTDAFLVESVIEDLDDVQFLYLQRKRASEPEPEPLPAPVVLFSYDSTPRRTKPDQIPEKPASPAEVERKHADTSDMRPAESRADAAAEHADAADERDQGEGRDYANLVDNMVQRFESLGAR